MGKGYRNCGSSPRVRGTAYLHQEQTRPANRFIPACAGNSSADRRVRAMVPAFGSSPRVRGTVHNACPRLAAKPRFIPACAGNRLRHQLLLSATVHPRVCGEQPPRFRTAVLRPCGSSPRVRGTADSRLIGIVELRFIPACAGNSREVTEDHRDAPVHPRVCGEQCSFVVSVICSGGSSPRVRGTVFRIHPGDARHRFIPACAGNRPDLAWADIS